MKAYIYFDNTHQYRKYPKDYTGEGPYVLVIESGGRKKIVNRWYCSSRAWAESDLTTGWEESTKELHDNNITEVYSNDKLVWSQDNTEKVLI